MLQTKNMKSSVHILANQMEVFQASTNWHAQGMWIPFTKVKNIGIGTNHLGERIEAFTGIGKFGVLDTMTITKWDPPHICEVTHTGKVVKGSGVFEVINEQNGAKFIWVEYFALPSGPFGTILWAALWLPIKVGMVLSLHKFSRNYQTISKL